MSQFFQKLFQAIDEPYPGKKWQQFYTQSASSYRQWFLKEGELNRPSFINANRPLKHICPNLCLYGNTW